MALPMTPEEGQAKIDPGTYEVICMNVSKDQLKDPQYGDGKVIRIDLETVDVMGEDGNPVKLDTIANEKLSPKSKLWGYCEAFGLAPAIGKPLDLEDMINQHVFAVVGVKDGADGAVFARVESLVPMPRKGQPRPSQGSTGGKPDYPAFWAAVEAMGFKRSSVTPYLDGDLTQITSKDQAWLDATLKEMGGGS